MEEITRENLTKSMKWKLADWMAERQGGLVWGVDTVVG